MTPSPTLPAQESALPVVYRIRKLSPVYPHGQWRYFSADGAIECQHDEEVQSLYATPPIQQGVVEALELSVIGLANAKSYDRLPATEQASVGVALDAARAALASLRPPVEKP